MQRHGVDFDETFAPVCKYNSLRILLSIVATEDLELDQLDIVTAFLIPNLKELVYMQQPDGIESTDPKQVCQLLKSLYGLKQAPRAWNQEIDTFLKSIGFTSTTVDPCVYIGDFKEEGKCYINLYVDDMPIAAKRPLLNRIKNLIKAKFNTTDNDSSSACFY